MNVDAAPRRIWDLETVSVSPPLLAIPWDK
jgi:hypothetical protein